MSNTSFEIRTYTASDEPVLQNFIAELNDFERNLEPDRRKGKDISAQYLRYLLQTISEYNGRVFLAWKGNEPIGFISAYLTPVDDEVDMLISSITSYGYVQDIFVDSTFRAQGVGKLLLTAAEEYLRSQGAQLLRINVLSKNEGARSAYERFGFRPYEMLLQKNLK